MKAYEQKRVVDLSVEQSTECCDVGGPAVANKTCTDAGHVTEMRLAYKTIA
jgi:hypothetical protein